MTAPRRSARSGPPLNAWEELFAEYEGTPYLTGLTEICSALGVFIGAWTVIILLGDLHRGFGTYWSLILILVIDIGLNIALRVIRARRRRALGLTREQRHWRLGLGPRPRQR
jgi:hypothetical protein